MPKNIPIGDIAKVSDEFINLAKDDPELSELYEILTDPENRAEILNIFIEVLGEKDKTDAS